MRHRDLVARRGLAALLATLAGCTPLLGVELDADATVARDDGAIDDLATDAAWSDAAAADAEPDGDPAACAQAPDGCNYVSNEGCTEGLRCGFFSDVPTGSRCVSEGAAQVGERCAFVTDCYRGLACVDGRCLRVCCPGYDSLCGVDVDSGRPSTCALPLRGSTVLRACTIPCNPFEQDCPDGMNCASSSGAPTCVQAGTTPVGGPCTGTSGQCGVGAVCANTDAGRFCHWLCGLRRPCPDGGACQLLVSGYGACRL